MYSSNKLWRKSNTAHLTIEITVSWLLSIKNKATAPHPMDNQVSSFTIHDLQDVCDGMETSLYCACM